MPALGVTAIWEPPGTLTVLTSQHDAVRITMHTGNRDLAKAEQIFRLAAPKLRAPPAAPTISASARRRFLAWEKTGPDLFLNAEAGIGPLLADLRVGKRSAVEPDALALLRLTAEALKDPSPFATADYKAAMIDATGFALSARRHVLAVKLLNAAEYHVAAFGAAMQTELAPSSPRAGREAVERGQQPPSCLI